MYLGNGDGTFGPFLTAMFFGYSTSTANVGLAADMNGDGKQDLIFSGNGVPTFVLINTTASVPGATFSPSTLTFPSQTVGTSSGQTPVTLTNTGAVALKVTSITMSGANAGEFSQTNNCSTVQPATTCTINVTFNPTAAGTASASVLVADNAGSGSQTIALSGTGVAATGPVATFSPTSLTFPSQTVGTSSSQTPITLTNTGAVALKVTSITMSGANASEFSQTNTCTTVQPTQTCSIKVTFTPIAAGTASASVLVADNAGSGSQTVALSGTGATSPSFSLPPASGSPPSATVMPGSSATFNLAITPSGAFSGMVDLACGISPTATLGPTCKVPATVQVTSGTTANVTVTVNTTASTAAGTVAHGKFPPGAISIAWTVFLFTSAFLLVVNRKRWPALAAPVLVLALISLAGCGGSSSSSSGSSGTPANTYTVTVTATSGSLTAKTTLKVIVQ